MFLPATITLKFGDSGDFVTELQRRLVAVNCFSDAMVNGFYDGNTTNAVRSFQGMVGLTADGVAGPETLRRLNGVIAGDTATSGSAPQDAPKDEPAAVAPQGFMWGSAAPEPAPIVPSPPIAAEIAAPEIAPSRTEPERAPEPVRAPEPTPIATQQMPQQSGSDLLAGMVPPSAMPSQNSPAAFGSIPISERQPLQAPGAPQNPAAMAQQNTLAAQPAGLMVDPTAAAPERPSLLSRATQMANAVLQKLSDYFERKLPPSVLNEVKEIGLEMARSGVKEIPIPVAPEARQAELPGRSQEPIKAR